MTTQPRKEAMSDLSDEELELACTVGTRLETANHRAYVDRDTLAMSARLQRAAQELQRHRAAIAADRERVRQVVRDAAHDLMGRQHDNESIQEADWSPLFDAIADRCAEQLATPVVMLSAEEREVLLAIRQSVVCTAKACADQRPYVPQVAVLDRLLGDKP